MANLFKADLGSLGPALAQLAIVGVTDEMWEKIGDKDGEYASAVYEALVAKMNGSATSETITIPADATAEGLVAEAKAAFRKAKIPFTHFDEDLLQLVRQDLELVRGQTLKVHQHSFGRDWETTEGRTWQKSVGADGNAAAYLVWVTKTRLMGWSVSIANDDARLFRHAGGNLCAPFFNRVDGRREFGLDGVQGCWLGRRSVVAFSAI